MVQAMKNQHEDLMAFKAPAWSTGWCPVCDWDNNCPTCQSFELF